MSSLLFPPFPDRPGRNVLERKAFVNASRFNSDEGGVLEGLCVWAKDARSFETKLSYLEGEAMEKLGCGSGADCEEFAERNSELIKSLVGRVYASGRLPTSDMPHGFGETRLSIKVTAEDVP